MASIFKAKGSLEKPELVEKKSAPLPPGSFEVADHHEPSNPIELNQPDVSPSSDHRIPPGSAVNPVSFEPELGLAQCVVPVSLTLSLTTPSPPRYDVNADHSSVVGTCHPSGHNLRISAAAHQVYKAPKVALYEMSSSLYQLKPLVTELSVRYGMAVPSR